MDGQEPGASLPLGPLHKAVRMRRLQVLGAVIVGLATTASFADGRPPGAEGTGDSPPWPEEWFAPPQTASELGITSFSQSPYLDDRGLPPVEQRLPDDPVVSQPYQSVGKYGGTARITLWDSWQFFNWEHALTLSADMRNVLPNLAESWSLSEDGRVTTITLRKGLKWSDGHPLTSEDFLFRFNHVHMDPEMSPVTFRPIRGGKVVKIDDQTFQYVFPDPNPMFVNFFAQYGSHMADPAHFFSQYHPAYRDKEELAELIEDEGFVTWMAMYGALRGWGNEDAVRVPTLRAYRVIERTPTKMRLERNPYYFKIDPEGRQLPYIDKVDAIILLENSKMIAFQAATGQLDFAAFALKTEDIPLLKLGEVKGVNRVHVWTRLHISDVSIQPNYNYDDPKYRELLWGTGERRFIRALSHAINRPQMNDVIYFGRGTPSQVTAHPTSRWHEERFQLAHTRYDPDYANEMLDELGLEDVDGDGLREYPDGSKLTITFEYLELRNPEDHDHGTGARILARGGHRPAPEVRGAAASVRTCPSEQDADDAVARRQGDGPALPPPAGLVLSPPHGLGHRHVEPLGTLLPNRRPAGRGAAAAGEATAGLGRRLASGGDGRDPHQGGEVAAQRRGGEPLDHRHRGAGAAPRGGLQPAQERDAHGHLGLGQSLDAVVPPVDLVLRRVGRRVGLGRKDEA